MIVNVIEAKYIENFTLELLLSIVDAKSNKTIEKQVDLEEYIKSKKPTGVFAPLRDINYFKNFKLNANTVEWSNGADIAPERFLEL